MKSAVRADLETGLEAGRGFAMNGMVRNESTAQLADDLIGAAQELEKAAKALRADAKAIRQHGLYPSETHDVVANQRMHKHYDVTRATARAAAEIKYEAGDFRIYAEDARCSER